MNDHIDPDLLLFYLDDAEPLDEREEIRRHLETCANCSEYANELREAERAITDGPTEKEVRAGAEAIGIIARRMERETEAARQTVATLRKLDVLQWTAWIEQHGAVVTQGLVLELILEARTALNKRPQRALHIHSVAAVVLFNLPRTSATSRYTAELLKDQASALRLLGRFSDALNALAAADEALSGRPDDDFARAHHDWARANVYFDLRKFADAATYVDRARRTFRIFHDTGRLAQLDLLMGAILYEQGDTNAALSKFAAASRVFSASGDEGSLARAYAGHCACAIRLDNFEEAMRCAEIAVRGYSALGMDTEIVRLRWNLSQMLLRQGRSEEGRRELEAVHAAFGSLGMSADAASVGLDILAELAAQREWTSAAVLARQLVIMFSLEGSAADAAEASDLLRRAVLANAATPELITSVRQRILGRLGDVVYEQDDELPS